MITRARIIDHEPCAPEGAGGTNPAAFRPNGVLVAMSVWLVLIACSAVARPEVVVTNKIGPFGGIIRGFAIDPTTPSILYASTYFGGTYKSVDAGQSWSFLPNTDGQVGGPVVVDPHTTSTVYVSSNTLQKS